MSTCTYDRIFDQATDHLDDLGWPPALIVERVLEFFDIHVIQAGQSRTTLETGIIPTPLWGEP